MSGITKQNIRRLINKSIIQICTRFFFFLEILKPKRNNLSNFSTEKSAHTKSKRENHALIQSIVTVANIYSFLNINCNNMNGKIFINLDWVKKSKTKKHTQIHHKHSVTLRQPNERKRERIRNPFVQKAHIKPKKEWINSL